MFLGKNKLIEQLCHFKFSSDDILYSLKEQFENKKEYDDKNEDLKNEKDKFNNIGNKYIEQKTTLENKLTDANSSNEFYKSINISRLISRYKYLDLLLGKK